MLRIQAIHGCQGIERSQGIDRILRVRVGTDTQMGFFGSHGFKGESTESWNPGILWNLVESNGILWNLSESNGIQWNPMESMESDGILQNLGVFSLKALGCTLLQENLLKHVNN
jgi:hypothetical protein